MEAAAPAARPAALPWTLYAAVLGSTSIVVGLLWDISWHSTIGRDTFWTPAHMAIYLGGVLAGVAAGYLALKTTFAGTAEERAAAVRFWGFRAPLGAWVMVWGAIAMLTSAPFDDWWHNAYGLDVKIISPPHALLAAGMFAIQIGAMLLVASLLNRAADRDGAIGLDRAPLAGGARRRLSVLCAYTAGVLLVMAATFVLEYSDADGLPAARPLPALGAGQDRRHGADGGFRHPDRGAIGTFTARATAGRRVGRASSRP